MTRIPDDLFDPDKAAEVAFILLDKMRRSNGEVAKVSFIRWIYLAERLSYELHGEPLTGDTPFSMRHGPVLSKTLEMIEAPSATNSLWNKVVKVEKRGECDYLKIRNDAPYTDVSDLQALSDSEIGMVEEVFERFDKMNAKNLEATNYAEWKWKPGQGSNPIEMEVFFQQSGILLSKPLHLLSRCRLGKMSRQFSTLTLLPEKCLPAESVIDDVLSTSTLD